MKTIKMTFEAYEQKNILVLLANLTKDIGDIIDVNIQTVSGFDIVTSQNVFGETHSIKVSKADIINNEEVQELFKSSVNKKHFDKVIETAPSTRTEKLEFIVDDHKRITAISCLVNDGFSKFKTYDVNYEARVLKLFTTFDLKEDISVKDIVALKENIKAKDMVVELTDGQIALVNFKDLDLNSFEKLTKQLYSSTSLYTLTEAGDILTLTLPFTEDFSTLENCIEICSSIDSTFAILSANNHTSNPFHGTNPLHVPDYDHSSAMYPPYNHGQSLQQPMAPSSNMFNRCVDERL